MKILKSSLNIVLPILITVLITIIIETVLYFKKVNTQLSNQIKNYLVTLDTIKLSVIDELKKISVFNKLKPKVQNLIVNELKKEMTSTLRESTNDYDNQLDDKRNQIMIAYLVLLFTFGLIIVVSLIFFREYIDWFKLIIYSILICISLVGTGIFFIKKIFPNLAIINGYDILFGIISSIVNYLQIQK